MKFFHRIAASLAFLRLMGALYLLNFKLQAKLVSAGTRAGLRGIWTTKGQA